MRKLLTFILFIFFSLMSYSQSAIYIQPADSTPGGNDDTGDGSIGSPYATLQKGIDELTTAGGSVSARGICYDTSENPTTGDNTIASGSGTGEFSIDMTGLNKSTTYYVRGYATNEAGTAYSDQESFTTQAADFMKAGGKLMKVGNKIIIW